jgi:hypothetical protein
MGKAGAPPLVRHREGLAVALPWPLKSILGTRSPPAPSTSALLRGKHSLPQPRSAPGWARTSISKSTALTQPHPRHSQTQRRTYRANSPDPLGGLGSRLRLLANWRPRERGLLCNCGACQSRPGWVVAEVEPQDGPPVPCGGDLGGHSGSSRVRTLHRALVDII